MAAGLVFFWAWGFGLATETSLAQAPIIRWKKQPTMGDAAPKTQVLTLQAFLAAVAETHPMVRQAVLYKQLGRAQLQEARGGFDPKIAYDNSHKWLGGAQYYDINEIKTTIPVRAGLNLTGGYEYAAGANAPNEYTLGKGIYFGGIEWQVGRGLLIDARRAGVLQGKNAVRLGETQTQLYANKVLAQAAKDYWEFYYDYQEAGYLREGVDLAENRLEGVTLKFRVGEEAAIDTVEAEILFQDRTNQWMDAWNSLRNNRLRLKSYIWGPVQGMDILDSLTIPEPFALSEIPLYTPDVAEGVALVLAANPELQARRVELQQLDIDRRLAREMLRPQADIKYQLLGKEGTALGSDIQTPFRNNYRFGLDLGMNLFLRKERGKLAQIKIKTEQNRLALQQAEREAEIVYRQLRNDLAILRQQIATLQRMVTNYQVLRDGEAIKFTLGESSLFLVNTRETKLIEAEIKLASLRAKWQKARVELLLLAGKLTEGLPLPEK
jgi:outer membrane protein TolC